MFGPSGEKKKKSALFLLARKVDGDPSAAQRPRLIASAGRDERVALEAEVQYDIRAATVGPVESSRITRSTEFNHFDDTSAVPHFSLFLPYMRKDAYTVSIKGRPTAQSVC